MLPLIPVAIVVGSFPLVFAATSKLKKKYTTKKERGLAADWAQRLLEEDVKPLLAKGWEANFVEKQLSLVSLKMNLEELVDVLNSSKPLHLRSDFRETVKLLEGFQVQLSLFT